MTASPSESIAAIEPGSTEYGDRATLEAGLTELGGGAGVGPGGSPAPGATPLPATGDPLGELMGGGVPGNPNLPLTDGLSVGPGAGPAVEDPMLSTRAERIRVIATSAESPMLRAAARAQLRAMAGGSSG